MVCSNYLDDFIFMQEDEQKCNALVNTFIRLCSKLGIPMALDKTEFAATSMVFLGILIDSRVKVLAVPEEKKVKTLNVLLHIISKKKATVHQLQSLAGSLNFLCKAIHPAGPSQGECMQSFLACGTHQWLNSRNTIT